MSLRWNKDENIRECAYWLAHKIELIELKHNQLSTSTTPRVLRGGIFMVELGMDNIGGEKNKKRPCLVISRKQLNMGDTVVVLPLTRKFPFLRTSNGEKKPKYDNHYILKKSIYPFLASDSCIKCEDIRTVDKVRIKEHMGNISTDDLDLIKNRLLFTMGY